MSGTDKRLTNAYYEIEIDPKTGLPVRIKVTALAGRKGRTRTDGTKIIGGEHAAFHFEYQLSGFGAVEPPDMPKEAATVLAKL